MRFLYFSFEMPPLLRESSEIAGGAAIQWLSWIKGFRENGHEFGLLTWQGAQKYINKKLNFDIVECYNPNYGIKKLRLFYYQIPKLYFVVKKYQPNYLIQSSATNYTFLIMLVGKLLRIPFIHRMASDVYVDKHIYTLVPNRISVFLYRISLKYSDFILAQNGYQFTKLKEKYPLKNIFILHNPYELDTEISEILPRVKREYIAWVGNFRKIKNLPALVYVAKTLPEVNFKIAGKEHANLDSETKDALSELKKFKNVEFVGYLKRFEIKPFLSKAFALLNTSINEGFSNTFLEAWAVGVPVITTKNVNPDEIVNKYDLGKVAEDYNQLPELIKIINTYEDIEYTKLSLRCHEYVKENHNPKLLAEKLVLYLNSFN